MNQIWIKIHETARLNNGFIKASQVEQVDPCSQNIPIWANWRAILKDFRAEPQMYLLWDICAKENKYIGELESHVVLDTLEAVAERINL